MVELSFRHFSESRKSRKQSKSHHHDSTTKPTTRTEARNPNAPSAFPTAGLLTYSTPPLSKELARPSPSPSLTQRIAALRAEAGLLVSRH